ncbi:MAG: lamin tail domain-containing protein [Myxococcales bacterium]|nr:lamin tail domain-containing protein [Myxococcales bacterium]
MRKWNQQRTGRAHQALGALLGASLLLVGCFQEDFSQTDDDDDGTSGGTTLVDPGTDESGDPPGSTGQPTLDGSTGDPDSTTSGGLDESTGSESGDESTGGDTSTGTGEDETTGEMALSVDELAPGDLVITEVMYNPHCGQDACEWFEVLNATESPVNLLDLYVQDNDYNAGNQGRVTVDLVLAAGDVAVLTRGLSTWNYDFEPDAVYGPNPGLNNSSPERVVIRNGTEVLDDTALFYDGDEGVAWSLSGSSLDAVSNDDSGYWCPAVTPLPTLTTTEYGSPGAINPPC